MDGITSMLHMQVESVNNLFTEEGFIARETCLFCVSKHISQAIVLVTECAMGYPEHIWLAIGHLAEAETESCSEFPELSENIRRVRLALMGQEGKFKHSDLMGLLKLARFKAEKINGLSEEIRIFQILYPEEEYANASKEDS